MFSEIIPTKGSHPKSYLGREIVPTPSDTTTIETVNIEIVNIGQFSYKGTKLGAIHL